MDPLLPLPYGPAYKNIDFSYDSVAGITLACPGALDVSEVNISICTIYRI
jgi:hypothetical protein